MSAARPRVVVSRCLLGGRCRYDGRVIRAPAVTRLGRRVDFVPVCPETGIGLRVPRGPLRLVKSGGRIRLVRARTGQDLTARMRRFSRSFLAGLEPDGFMLKSRSPSCAVRDAAVFDAAGRVVAGTGLFAAAAQARFPRLPVEDETALDRTRGSFLERVLRAAAGRAAARAGSCRSGGSAG